MATILLAVLIQPLPPLVRVLLLEAYRSLLHQGHVAKDHRVVQRVAGGVGVGWGGLSWPFLVVFLEARAEAML